MKNNFSAFLVGLIFAIGLGVSGMTSPAKVIGFLDLFGAWDPSLMFVMVGAISVHGILFHLIRKRPSPLFSTAWHVPQKKDLTPSLMIGSVLFGIGWGIGGYCPGPAITSLFSGQIFPVIFVVSMLAGMVLFLVLNAKLKFRL